MKLPAKEAVIVANQVARGLDLLKGMPTSFLTARAAKMKWQMSNRGYQVAGMDCNWEEMFMVSICMMLDTVMVSANWDMMVVVLS